MNKSLSIPAGHFDISKCIFTLSVILFLNIYPCYAQNAVTAKQLHKQINEVLTTANEQKMSTPQSIIMLDSLYHQAKSQDFSEEVAYAGVNLMRYNMHRNHNEKVISTGNDIIKNTKKMNDEEASELHRMMGLSYGNLGLLDESYEEYQVAIRFAEKIKDKDIRHYIMSLCYENFTSYFDQSKKHSDSILYYLSKSLCFAEAIAEQSKTISADLKLDQLVLLHSNLGLYYMYIALPAQPELAEQHLLNALTINETKQGQVFKLTESALLAALSKFYYTQGKYDKALAHAQKALILEKEVSSPYLRTEIYEVLAKTYQAQGNKDESIKYMDILTVLNDSLKIVEKAGTATSVQQLSLQEKESSTKKVNAVTGIAAGLILIISLTSFLLWKKKKLTLRKRYEQIIEKLKIENTMENNVTANEAVKAEQTPDLPGKESVGEENHPYYIRTQVVAFIEQSEEAITGAEQPEVFDTERENDKTKHTTAISDSTLAKLQVKLEKFERSDRYLRKDINLISVAHYLDTNQTYLSELIKLHKGTTFSNYINSLKIEYIIRKLYEDPVYREYKISHLAEECGFASRQVFMQVFKKITGVTPSYYISRLKEENS